jgi:seryl-tRNA synthetase
MLDIRRIRDNEAEIREGLINRNADTTVLDDFIEADKKRRAVLTEVETLKSQRNTVSKDIGLKKRNGEDTTEIQNQMKELGQQIAALDKDAKDIEESFHSLLLKIPNVPCKTIPAGKDESANRIVKVAGEPGKFDFAPQDHVTIGEKLGIFDFERGTKITGSGFPLLLGMGSRLQRALIQFMLDMHVDKHGYTEMLPPFVCNTASMTGTGQLPKMEDDMYKTTEDSLYLIPTAEVPVTNFYREEIIDKELPVYLTAYTPCFRREAGAAGKVNRGLIRVHQFDKVEMVKFVKPETSYDELETLLDNAEDVLRALGLHYRILELCTGDISFAAAKCYDIELWAPGQNAWLEVSSCSNFEDFQARRAGIKYRDDNGKTQFVHTLNGSGVALPRLMVAILENGQQEDGSVVLPDAIVPYMGGVKVLRP